MPKHLIFLDTLIPKNSLLLANFIKVLETVYFSGIFRQVFDRSALKKYSMHIQTYTWDKKPTDGHLQ